MRQITTQHTKRFLATLAALLCIAGFVAAQTFTQVNEDKIPNARGEAKWFTYGEGSKTGKVQATHELKEIVYFNPGEEKTLHIQTRMVQYYQRWFRYDKREALPSGFNFGVKYTDLGVDGWYYGNTDTRPKIYGGTIGSTIAVDLSRSESSGSNDNDVIEPVLSYRMVYEIRHASEMADALTPTSKDNPLESYDMIAPTGKQLLIGPKHIYTFGHNTYFALNYYINSNDGITHVTGRNGDYDNNLNSFYWVCEDEWGNQIEEITYSASQEHSPGNNNAIYDRQVFNGRILSVPKVDYATVRTWYLVNRTGRNGSHGQCIARFRITYMSPDEIGPHIGEIPGKERETLESLYKPLVNRDFDFLAEQPDGCYYKERALPWAESSYGFYSNHSVHKNHPEWSEYAFIRNTNTSDTNMGSSWSLNGIYDRTHIRTKGDVKGRMYYIDAAETPGVVSNLDISDACCPGTQIYVATWIHNAQARDNAESLGPNLNVEMVGKKDGREQIFKPSPTGPSAVEGMERTNCRQVRFSDTVRRCNEGGC